MWLNLCHSAGRIHPAHGCSRAVGGWPFASRRSPHSHLHPERTTTYSVGRSRIVAGSLDSDNLKKGGATLCEVSVADNKSIWQKYLYTRTLRREKIGTEQILLGIIAVIPFRRIVVGQENIMEVHHHTLTKTRQQIHKHDGYIRIRERSMRAIDEQEVT